GRAGIPGLDITSMATELRLPALIVHSTDDREVPVAASRRLAQAWAGSERVQVEGLGHRRLLRNPAAVSQVVGFVAPSPQGIRTPPERAVRIAAAGAGGRGARRGRGARGQGGGRWVWGEARRRFDGWIARSPGSPPGAGVQLAEEAVTASDAPSAIQHLESCPAGDGRRGLEGAREGRDWLAVPKANGRRRPPATDPRACPSACCGTSRTRSEGPFSKKI